MLLACVSLAVWASPSKFAYGMRKPPHREIGGRCESSGLVDALIHMILSGRQLCFTNTPTNTAPSVNLFSFCHLATLMTCDHFWSAKYDGRFGCSDIVPDWDNNTRSPL